MKNFIFLLFIALLFSHCKGELGNTVQLQYDLTVCDDPWELHHHLDSPEEKANIIENYLKEQDEIDLHSIIVEKLSSGNMESCFGCVCTTGDVATLTVNSMFEIKLIELGFYEE